MKPIRVLEACVALGYLIPISANQPVHPTEGLVLYYPFDGNALDAGPLANSGTLSSARLSRDRFGRVAAALGLTGTGAFLEANNPLPESESLTVSLWLSLDSWVQLQNWGAPQVIFFEGDDQGGRDVACYLMGGLHFYVKSNESLSYVNWLPPLNTWIHLVCVADSAQQSMSIWIDGKRVKEGSFSRGANTGFHGAFNLGRRPGGYNDWFLAGSLDEVRVYDRALTAEEIGTLYALDAGRAGKVQIAIETMRVTLDVIPGVSYLLQSSSDMEMWTDHGAAFVATSAKEQVTVNAVESGRFWRLIQSP